MAQANLPNAPLGEVVFEIRFHGDLSLFSRWGDIQQELQPQFPKLFAPRFGEGDAPSLKPFHITSDDQSERVTLAINLFGFITQKYTDYASFRVRYEPLLGLFLRHYQPRGITRTGLRYLNWLPATFPAESVGPDRLHPALNLRLTGFPANVRAIQPLLVTRMASDEFSLTVQLGEDERGVRLDFDCYSESEISSDQVLGVLDAQHRLIDEVFFSLVTPEYLAYMRGDFK